MTDEIRPPPPVRPSAGSIIDWDPTLLTWADCSHWHPLQDAQAYAAANHAGLVGIKVSQGSSPAALGGSMVAAAEASGLIVVGYEYGPMHPDAFLKLFPPRPGRIPCLDFEGDGITVALAEAWIRAVATAYGRQPWFYAGVNWTQAGAPEHTAMASCPWWGPQYGPHLRVPRGVGKPVAWQYSEGVGGPPHATLEHVGVKGKCDMNALLVGLDELHAMAGLGVTTIA